MTRCDPAPSDLWLSLCVRQAKVAADAVPEEKPETEEAPAATEEPKVSRRYSHSSSVLSFKSAR